MVHGQERSVPRSLYVAMVLQFAIGGAVVPFISMFLRDKGLDFGHISLVLLASSSTLLFFPFLWGMLADRVIPLNRLFALLNLLIFVMLAAFSTQTTFPGFLVCFAFFYAAFNPSLTLINALSFHHLERPQEQFGRVRAWGSLGWILPSFPIFLWLTAHASPKLDFVLYLGMALSLAMGVAAFFLPHTPCGGHHAPHEKPAYWLAVKSLLREPDYLVALASFFLISASFFLLTFYSPPFLEDAGVPRAWIGLIHSIAIVFEIGLLFRLKTMIARWNYTTCLLVGCASLALRHLLFAHFSNLFILIASYVLAGMVVVFYHNTVSILANTIAADEVRATAQTMLVFVSSGLGPTFANWVSGHLATKAHDSLRPVFWFAAVLAFLAGVLILFRAKNFNGRNHAMAQLVEEPIAVLD